MFSALHPSKFPTCCMNWDLFKYPQLLGFHGKEEIKQGKIYFVCLQKQLTITEQGCEKYSDFSVSQWSIIYWRLWQIVDLRDNDKWRYFEISGFNNCVIIWSLFCLSTEGVVKSISFSTGNVRNRSAILTRAWFQLRMRRIFMERILIKKKDWIEPLLFHFLSQEIYSGRLGETILLWDLSMARIVARILYYRFVCFGFRLQIQSCGQ